MPDLRNLRVLAAAHDLSAAVHEAASGLDVSKVPGLRAQLLAAVDAIPANISEGAGLGTDQQFARGISIALGSANEVGSHLRVARASEALDERTVRRCQAKRAVVCQMLERLLRVVRSRLAYSP
ncbi:four helix bundle protein [Gemmatimonas aurantiaca]|uniref:four helix bundle protein n=1 Tax=Gemmatimonas aurantiaca TaxID=173480 RepID=UPI00301CB546